ncbi:hypothetical protein D9615_004048 [Tricholomella constricta]|uniref:RING-type domain-containing protein n=1 Tax=Tricholomella constricta TaxID=117010 RepID=A0A8H5HCQ2_9AGAR|nr:hypothetical protein D9615_004048 [Tricholomella constricta]
MSLVSASQDHGFWEFANCGRCQIPFTSPSGATVPFWLTECGHIVCNNHLNADQSCSICGAPGIQLVPLQREMEAPMSEWFQSVPMSLDAVANAAKFQHETMASQIRYYRARHQQQRAFIERLKHDVGEFKKARENERLNGENNQLRQQLGGHDQYPGRGYNDSSSERPDVVNSNGKRPRTGAHPYNHRHGAAQATSSSPRSIVTPLGPDRLTLPQAQPAPNLSSNNIGKVRNSLSHADPSQHGPGASQTQHRPVSAFIDKYAYVPPATPQFHPQQLTHTQAAPQVFKRTKPNPEQQQTRSQPPPPPQNQDYRSMPPPPTPARFKAARGTPAPNNSTNQFSRPRQIQATPQAHQEHRTMAESFSQAARPQQSGHSQSAKNTAPGTNRFFPPVQQVMAPSPAIQAQHLMPSLGNGPQRFVPPASRASSRAQRADFAGGGQRMPFVSRGQGPGEYN